MMGRFKIRVFIGLVSVLSVPVLAQLTQDQLDSGWVELFNGENLDGFYTVMGGNVGANGPNDNNFTVENGTIHVKAVGQGTGHIATNDKYSYYRYRVDMRFAVAGNLGQNAGCLYHIREDEPKIFGAFPRSIEAQGQKRGMGETWTISDVWVTTTVDNPNGTRHYDPNGTEVDHGDPNGRQIQGSSVPYVDNQWNTLELHVYGSDSAIHIVNGIRVMKMWNLRVAADNAPNDFSDPLDEGNIGLQSEGSEISYRNIHIMELDPNTLEPINGAVRGCTDPSAENYASLATADAGDCEYSGCTDTLYSNYFCNENPDAFPCVDSLGYSANDIDNDNTCATGVVIEKSQMTNLLNEMHYITVQITDASKEYEIQVYGALGKLLFKKEGRGRETFRVPLSNGIYFVKHRIGSQQGFSRINLIQ